jgi:hypothetical protein
MAKVQSQVEWQICIAYEILLNRASTRGLDKFEDADHLTNYLRKSVVKERVTRHRRLKAEMSGGRIDFIRIDADPSLQTETARSAHEWIPALNPDTLEIMEWHSRK